MATEFDYVLQNMQKELEGQVEKVNKHQKDRDAIGKRIGQFEAQLSETNVVLSELGKTFCFCISQLKSFLLFYTPVIPMFLKTWKRTFQDIRLISFLLEILDEDAIVYKLLGPVLVKQEKEIALQTIKNRKDFMESELKK